MNARTLIARARAAGRLSLDEASGKRVLAEFGVPVPKSAIATSAEDVESVLGGLIAPFVVKVMSQDILHKSDAGGVALRLADAASVSAAIDAMLARREIAAARVDGFLIEEMAAPGREVVIGGIHDRQFGPMLMVGFGGVFVEILKDVAFRLCPITERDARAMLSELRGARLFDGVRGLPAIDKSALLNLMLRIGGEGGLMSTLGDDVAEIDINPVIVGASGAVAVDARIILKERVDASDIAIGAVAASDTRPWTEQFAPLFSPKTVAVIGASTSSTPLANTFIRRMKAFGYPGKLWAIHPTATEIEGVPCFPRLVDAPEIIDYAYIAIGARNIPDLLAAANGRVTFAQVISSGFGETAAGESLQADLVAKAHGAGCRVLGPNCIGLYSPRGGVTFASDAPREVGTVGVITQSGGLGTDIIKRGQWRGVRFSGLVTLGNSADIGPIDLLEYFIEDAQTKVIGLYLEDVKQGRRFFDVLRSGRATKPVVVLRGGRTSQGGAAAASHTGALAGDNRAWLALSEQTGCVLVDTVDQFIDALLAFQFLDLRSSRPTQKVVLFGNGGGTSVLAADAFADRALDVLPFGQDTLAQLEAMHLPAGTSVSNPIDAPVGTLLQEQGRIANRILEIVYTSGTPDAIVMHLNLAAFVGRGDVDPVDNLIQSSLDLQGKYPGRAHFLIVLRVDGSPQLDDRRRHYRQRALDAGIPVYDELVNAADALLAVRTVERYRHCA